MTHKTQSTEVQIHATTNLGGGARVIFNENVASRLEVYSMQYIETIDGTTLEMKNNLVIQLSGCIFSQPYNLSSSNIYY